MASKTPSPRFNVRPRKYVKEAFDIREDHVLVLADYAAALGENKKAEVSQAEVLEALLDELATEPFLIAFRDRKAGKNSPTKDRKGASSDASKEGKKPQTKPVDEAR